jgi:hypothetical protein
VRRRQKSLVVGTALVAFVTAALAGAGAHAVTPRQSTIVRRVLIGRSVRGRPIFAVEVGDAASL